MPPSCVTDSQGGQDCPDVGELFVMRVNKSAHLLFDVDELDTLRKHRVVHLYMSVSDPAVALQISRFDVKKRRLVNPVTTGESYKWVANKGLPT